MLHCLLLFFYKEDFDIEHPFLRRSCPSSAFGRGMLMGLMGG